MHAEIAKCTQR